MNFDMLIAVVGICKQRAIFLLLVEVGKITSLWGKENLFHKFLRDGDCYLTTRNSSTFTVQLEMGLDQILEQISGPAIQWGIRYPLERTSKTQGVHWMFLAPQLIGLLKTGGQTWRWIQIVISNFSNRDSGVQWAQLFFQSRDKCSHWDVSTIEK